ncbi:VCBS repeat-containing protein [bacterium]|nr:VCBS repeat-containing protein [bacterium]
MKSDLALAFTTVLATLAAPANAQFFGGLNTVANSDGMYDVTTADINSDGLLDLIWSSYYDGEIAFNANLGNGNWGPTQVLFTSTATVITEAHAVDFDGDGDIDVLSSDLNGIRWHENLGGALVFFTQAFDSSMREIEEFASADLDSDGILDIVTASSNNNFLAPSGVFWYRGLGGGAYEPRQTITSGVRSRSVAVADIDNDGLLDLVTGDDSRLAWHKNLGNGGFGTENLLGAGRAQDVEVVDLDADGDLDVVGLFSPNGPVLIIENLGSGSFAPGVAVSINGPLNTYHLAVGDFDGDVLPDIVVQSATGSLNRLFWLQNQGNCEFGPENLIWSDFREPWVPRAADIDNDGLIDVVTTYFFGDTIGIFYNQGGTDCNLNGIPDTQDIASGTSEDCNGNLIPDECDLSNGMGSDCNGNGRIDSCELLEGAADCDADGELDECQIAANPSLDLDADGRLDTCFEVGIRYCSPGTPNSTGSSGEALALGFDVAWVNNFSIGARNLPANSFGFFITSTTPGQIFPVANSVGTLCVIGDVGRGVGGGILNSGPDGAFFGMVDLTAIPQPTGTTAVQAGDTWFFQAWHRDSSGGQTTSNFTDAIAVPFQ